MRKKRKNNEMRHTCIECRKTRYERFMIEFATLNIKGSGYDICRHWICKSCKINYLKTLSSQIMLLEEVKKIIKKIL